MKEFFELLAALSPAITYAFFVFREIKEIFFDKDSEGESFGVQLKYVIFPWIRKRKKKIKTPESVEYTDEERNEVISNLLIHNFFQIVSSMKNNIPNMEFGHLKKSQVLRDVIRIYIETIEKHTMDLIKKNKLDELSTLQLNQLLMDEIGVIDFEIYSKMRNRLGDELYFKLIEDPVKGFKVRNSIFKEIFVNGVLLMSSQSMSMYGYDNYKRASEILTSMYISLQTIVRTFEKVFRDYNGELDKYF